MFGNVCVLLLLLCVCVCVCVCVWSAFVTSLQGEVALLTEAPRLATVRAKRRCTLLEVDKNTFLNMFADESPEALADFELKVVQRNADLKHVIHHPVGLQLFTDALEDEYSAENIHVRCWKRCCCVPHLTHCRLPVLLRLGSPPLWAVSVLARCGRVPFQV